MSAFNEMGGQLTIEKGNAILIIYEYRSCLTCIDYNIKF